MVWNKWHQCFRCCFMTCRQKRRGGGFVPVPGESAVWVLWKWLVQSLPAASPSQTLWYRLHTVADEHPSLEMGVSWRTPSTSGKGTRDNTFRDKWCNFHTHMLCFVSSKRMISTSVDQFLCCGTSYRVMRDTVAQALMGNRSDSLMSELQVRESPELIDIMSSDQDLNDVSFYVLRSWKAVRSVSWPWLCSDTSPVATGHRTSTYILPHRSLSKKCSYITDMFIFKGLYYIYYSM